MHAVGKAAPAEARAADGVVLFEQGEHRWVWLGADEDEDEGVSANQFLVQHGGRGCLLDPGSVLDFARTVANLSRYAQPSELDYLFFSHQDPDVSSAIPMWAGITTARLVMPRVWTRFLPHFGEYDQKRMLEIPDAGGRFTLAGAPLEVVPAHFLHSTGNILLYDPTARFLFTGDIGASVMPHGKETLYVEDFERHRPYLEGFHRRYMASNVACRDFVRRVSRLSIDAIVPQHGAIFRGPQVGHFLSWLEGLRCGVDLLGEMYGA